jgi:hypothetical protein
MKVQLADPFLYTDILRECWRVREDSRLAMAIFKILEN